MTPKLMGILALVPLCFLLLTVAQQDIRGYRIPNKLVLTGVVLGVALNGLLPEGWGFNSAIPGGLGWLGSLKGLGVGLMVLLPLYWLRAMGAGDVKLMAMVGAFVGANDVLWIVLATFIAGGVMALAMVLWSGRLVTFFQNIRLMLISGVVKMSMGSLPAVDEAPASVGKLPYAVAITMGTFGYLVWQRL